MNTELTPAQILESYNLGNQTFVKKTIARILRSKRVKDPSIPLELDDVPFARDVIDAKMAKNELFL